MRACNLHSLSATVLGSSEMIHALTKLPSPPTVALALLPQVPVQRAMRPVIVLVPYGVEEVHLACVEEERDGEAMDGCVAPALEGALA